jgi:hypothetical protein
MQLLPSVRRGASFSRCRANGFIPAAAPIESLWSNDIGCADARLGMFERIDHVVCPDMRDRTATEELLQDARPDFDQQDSGAMTSQRSNERSQRKNAGSINTRHVAHT